MFRRFTLLSVGILATLIGAAAGEEPRLAQGKEIDQVPAVNGSGGPATESKEATSEMQHRATEIKAMKVQNREGKDLGSIEDFVVDTSKCEVKYAALSYGGVLGLGKKLFAVPWASFEHRHNDKQNQHTLVLNIDESTLQKEAGFDRNAWPNNADPKFETAVEKKQGRVEANIDTGRTEISVDVQRKPAADRGDSTTKVGSGNGYRASLLIGSVVKNEAGKDLASIKDFVVVMATGKIRYYAVSSGGVLGIGEKLFAVPIRSLSFHVNDRTHYFVLMGDEKALETGKGFDPAHWPKDADGTFGVTVNP